MPPSASSAASCVCEVTGWTSMSSRMRAWRAERVSAVVTRIAPGVAGAVAPPGCGGRRLVSRVLQEPDEDGLLRVQPVLLLVPDPAPRPVDDVRSEEHTSELQS